MTIQWSGDLEARTKLRGLLSDGKTYAEIGEAFGGVSYGAIKTIVGKLGWAKAGQPSPWTDERVATLKRLFHEGYSASRSAKEIGEPITRNAVVAKWNRLGLVRYLKGRDPALMTTPTYRPRVNLPTVRKPRAPNKPKPPKEPKAMRPRPIEVLPENLLTIMQLGPCHCRWIFGDPRGEHGYCGKPKWRGAYCEGHVARATQTVAEARAAGLEAAKTFGKAA